MQTLLYFVRHGQTEWNRDGIYQGQKDSPLTGHGIEQIERVTDYLADKNVRHIFTSPLPRAKASAEIVGAALDIKPQVYDFLKEQNFGTLQGMPKEAAEREFSDFFEERKKSAWDKLHTSYPGGGESYFDVYNRIHDPLLAILDQLEGNTVFIGHESINRMLRGSARGLEPSEMVNYRQANDELVIIDLATAAETVVRV